MSAVSDTLRLSPSAISQQISQLELEAGVELIERRGRRVELTAAGRRLVQHVDQIVSVLEAARSDIEAMSTVVSGEIRIAVFPSIASWVLPKALANLSRDYPHITVRAEEAEPEPALQALLSWQTDVAFFDRLSVPDESQLGKFHISNIYDDELVAVLPAGHRLSRKRAIAFQDLKHEPWAIDTRPHAFSEVVFNFCRKLGFEPNVVAKFDAYDVISALVAEGVAISVLPRIRVNTIPRDNIVLRSLRPRVTRTIEMAVRKNEIDRPALRAVSEALVDASNIQEPAN